MTSNRLTMWSWALYDWANSAYATTVMAGFFPLFFKEYWAQGIASGESTYTLGLANSVSAAAIAIAAPILGAFADQGLGKKWFLGAFTLVGAVATAGLAGVGQGQWQAAIWLYAISSLAFSGALVFYDAMLVDVSRPAEMDRVSSWGYGLGYLGGGLLFAVNVLMYLKPGWFGLADGVTGIRASFVSVAVWWAAFAIPLFLFVREGSKRARPPLKVLVTSGWNQFWRNLRKMSRYRPLLLFFVAYLLYIDGVNTIMKMAVDYGMALGFQPADLISALLLVQFIGFPAAVGFGYLADRVGARRGIFICLWVYALITLLAIFMKQSWHFYLLAATIGLVQGGIQALSRSIYARMIPADQATEYFGFFNLLGKFSAIVGPLLVGAVSLATGEPRLSILVILAMFLFGGLMLKLSDPNYKVATNEVRPQSGGGL